MLLAVWLMSGCSGAEPAKTAPAPTPAPSNKLAILGSTTLLPVAQKAVEAFKQLHPEIGVTLSTTGSQGGINALTDGYADVALSSRDLKKEEKEKLHKRQRDAKETVVAWDGIVPIVHPSNPVKSLSLAQLKDIYTGKITNWQEVGGKKGEIIVVARDSNSGTHEASAELVLHNEPVVKSAQEMATSEAVLEMVASKPNAIGYDGLGYVEGHKQIHPVSVEGQAASTSSILDKSYKIARPLYMFTSEKTTTAVVEFLSFMSGPEGQVLVKKAGFAPIPAARGQGQ